MKSSLSHFELAKMGHSILFYNQKHHGDGNIRQWQNQPFSFESFPWKLYFRMSPPQKKQHFPDKQEVSSKFCKISCWWNFMEHQSLRWVIQFYFITKNLLKNHLLDKQEVGSKFKTWAKQCDSDNINPSLLKLPLKAAFQNDPPPKKNICLTPTIYF